MRRLVVRIVPEFVGGEQHVALPVAAGAVENGLAGAQVRLRRSRWRRRGWRDGDIRRVRPDKGAAHGKGQGEDEAADHSRSQNRVSPPGNAESPINPATA